MNYTLVAYAYDDTKIFEMNFMLIADAMRAFRMWNYKEVTLIDNATGECLVIKNDGKMFWNELATGC